jgi:hypothetical protein
MFWLSVENQVFFGKTKKTTKLMNHLGGSGCFGFMLSGSPEQCLWWSCVSHLWMATQEQRDWRHSSHEASSATTSQMGSVLIN